jgi:hypothetical protein
MSCGYWRAVSYKKLSDLGTQNHQKCPLDGEGIKKPSEMEVAKCKPIPGTRSWMRNWQAS